MNTKYTKLLLLLLLVLTTPLAFADTLLDNTANIDASASTGFYFGGGATTASGLNFYAPSGADTILSSFTLFLDGANITSTADQVEAVVANWSGSGIGSVVYTSSAVTVTSDGGNTSFSPYTFNNVNAQLTPSGSYVAFLTDMFQPGTSYTSFNSGDYAFMAVVDQPDSFPGGIYGSPQVQFVYDTQTFSTLYPANWDSVGNPSASGYDAAFQADFTSSVSPAPIPEPSPIILLGFGMMTLLGVIRFREVLIKRTFCYLLRTK